MNGDENCVCDHVYDEHDEFGECTVEDCPCFYFEQAEDFPEWDDNGTN